MSTLDRRNNVNNENLPRYKNSQLGVGLTTQTGGSVGKSGGSGESKEHPGGFPDFPKFQKNKSENLSRQKIGLADTTNTAPSVHGYINKIRRDSVSGKPKEQKKVSLVSHKVSFKPGARRSSVKEKKPFTVRIPDHAIHADELSPMDVESPFVKIRKFMTRVPHGVDDIDDTTDPFKCPQYAQEICDYLQAVERRWTFPANYLIHSKEVTPHMRAVLTDWLVQVQVHQELSQHTLHLCVAVIDRFICLQDVKLNVLQLVGITSMLIAAKYHERFPPEISDLCHLTDNTYTQNQVLLMERSILRTMKFDLSIPDPVVFLDRFLLVCVCDLNPLIRSMSMYLLDLALTEVAFVHFVASLLAASAIYVSRGLLAAQGGEWNKSLAHYTKYSEKDLESCVKAMRRMLSKRKNSKFQGAHTKYAHSLFHGISNHHSIHYLLSPTVLWPDGEEGDDHQNNCRDVFVF